MQIFIWENVREYLTDRYHDGGGLAIVAENLEQARALFIAESTTLAKDQCEILTRVPDTVYNVDTHAKPKVFIFPDAGCC